MQVEPIFVQAGLTFLATLIFFYIRTIGRRLDEIIATQTAIRERLARIEGKQP